MSRISRLAVVVLLLAAAAAAPLAAQTVTGTVQGTVTDTTDAPVPGVTVTLRNLETGAVREVVTNERGLYNAPFLAIGPYRVSAAMPGFGTVTRDRLTVRLNDTLTVDFRLDPSVREEVTVVAERPPVNSSTSDVKQALTAEQILDRPTVQNLNNNNTFLALAETFAGFQENPTSGQNNPTASSGSSINFNGTGTRGATFQIDGVNNDDSSENQNRQGVNLATIKEFQVISNTYSAEFGRGYGAVVLVQTKSGTNDVRGEVFYYRQDSEWNALQYGQLPTARPDNQRPSYGAVIGFPIVENKVFGFASFERGHRFGTGNYTRDLFIPIDFAGPRLSRGNDTPANRAFQDAILARYGGLTPNDPRGPRVFQSTVGFDQKVWDASLRLDWEPRATDRVTLRYQYSRQRFDNEDIILGEATQQNNRQANVGLTWTRTFSNRMVGEFRYGLGVRDTNVNIKEGNDTPIVRFAGSTFPTIIGNAGTFPINRDQMDHQFVYNLSTLLGDNHNLKAGTDVRLSALDDVAQNFHRGFWSFNASCGGVTYPSSWAAFWDGCVTSHQVTYGPDFLENRIREYNLYLDDSWKIRPNLSLNIGLRYEYAGAASETEDRIDYQYADDRDNIQPRVGFAWAPQWRDGFLGRLSGGPGNFSIRGGYGLYHGRIFQSVFSQTGASLRGNPPYALFRNFTTVPDILNLADPSGGFVFVPGPQTIRHSETLADPDLEMPKTHQWNLTFERALPWKSALRVTYSAAMGRGLIRFSPVNLAELPATVVNHPNNAPASGAPDLRGITIDRVANDWRCAGTGVIPGQAPNATCPNVVPIANNEISLRVPRTNERRPDPRFGQNSYVSNDASSWYHGLQLNWNKAFSHGLWFDMTYTWSKAIDDTSEATFVGAGDTNALGPDKSFARGLSRFHTPHRLTFNGTWRLPIFRDRRDVLGSVLGGWQLSAIVKLAHGTPFTVIDSATDDINWDGFQEDRPVLLDPSVLGNTVDDIARSQEQLPRAAFRRAVPGDTELVGRNTFFYDGVRNVDLGLVKTFRMPMNDRLMLRLNVFNALNRRQWALASSDIASANFGRILGQRNDARALQIEARYIF
ncbi:MAG TPA: TonB-dependent receptor [Vicinamibacteria bacterium]|nr:TonB-dependent receptor [Vicinamibacteria bacterium]